MAVTGGSGSTVDFASVLPVASSLRNALERFYTPQRVESVLLPLLRSGSRPSLRMLDWFCVNYAKKHNVVCRMPEPDHRPDVDAPRGDPSDDPHDDPRDDPRDARARMFAVYNGYKVALARYRRGHFDPFRRGPRIALTHEGETWETTVGQCNFIMWVHRTGVLRFARHHAAAVEEDMASVVGTHRRRRAQLRLVGGLRKRHTLTKASAQAWLVYPKRSVVYFDQPCFLPYR